ncbi:MAG: hypothetical protein K0R26_1911 [Bacteroidota bacterium]|nr:hypothetical protein [Bacteroidota bacterium]
MNDFAAGASQIGSGIAGFLNPIIGGTNTSTTTTTPAKNNTMLFAGLAVITLIAAVLLWPKK